MDCMAEKNLPSEPENQPAIPVEGLKSWKGYFELLKNGDLEQYRGKFVAVLGETFCGAGDDPGTLCTETAMRLKVEESSLAVAFVEDGEQLVDRS